MLSFDQYEDIICCCKQDIPHDESLKFKIIASAENLQIAPFKHTPEGSLIEHKDFHSKISIPRISNQIQIILRNDIIQQCFEVLSSYSGNREKMIVLKGPTGVGKSSIARAAIRYAIDRNFF